MRVLYIYEKKNRNQEEGERYKRVWERDKVTERQRGETKEEEIDRKKYKEIERYKKEIGSVGSDGVR